MPRWRRPLRSAAAPLLLGLCVALLAVSPVSRARERPRLAHADGPPLAHTGGFGEPTCTECHSGESVNAAPGMLRLSGLPPRYQPGHRYVLLIELERPGLTRAGFELAARSESGASRGAQAGELAAMDSSVAVRDTSTGIRYAMQTLAGSLTAPPVSHWRVLWTAPTRGPETVVVHVAANASNDDNSPLGDFIYTGSWRTRR